MNKININTSVQQECTCEELEAIAHDYFGIQQSLDDESYGCRATDNITLPDKIKATEGVYSDTKEAFVKAGVDEVSGTEYQRVFWDDDTFKSKILSALGISSVPITVEKASSLTSMPSASGCTSVRVLQSFKNVTSIAGSLFSSTVKTLGLKWVKYITGCNDFYCGAPISSRLIMPSVITIQPNGGQNGWNRGATCKLADLGPNCTSIGNYGCGGEGKYSTTFVLRNPNNVSAITNDAYRAIPYRLFVPFSLLNSYKSTAIYSTYPTRFFPIGGPTWEATFGSTDPYADLTEEEKSWYDDLFPDLYKDWVAPTSDE